MKVLPITIIIPTMNRPDTLKNTIEDLLIKNEVPNQIIIVDQSQKEVDILSTKKFLEKLPGLVEVKYIIQKEASLTKARNNGMKHCKNDILVFMDDDVYTNNDTLDNINNLMKDKKIAMIAGLDEYEKPSRSKIGYLFGKKSYTQRKIGHVTKAVFGRYPDNVKGIVETKWAMGYFFVVRASLINKWNLKWDEKLVQYGYPEDLDFSYTYYKRAHVDNFKCIISEDVKVKHECSREWRITSKKATYMYIINREYLSYKHFNFISRIYTRWSNLGELMFRILNKNKPLDMIKGQYYCDRYRKDIKAGKIPYHLYEN